MAGAAPARILQRDRRSGALLVAGEERHHRPCDLRSDPGYAAGVSASAEACGSKAEYSPVAGDWTLKFGERGWIRTIDPRLKRALLYQLSYAPTHLQI